MPGDQLSDTTPTETTPQDTKPAFVYDPEKYPLSESLASKDDVKEIGILSDGVIVDGLGFIDGRYQCHCYDEESKQYYYTSDCESAYVAECITQLMNGEIPEGCPVIKYTPNLEVIDNSGWDGGVELYYSVFGGPQEQFFVEVEPGNYKASDVPTKPGMYFLRMGKQNKNDPIAYPEITPVVGEWYGGVYDYFFILVFE